MMNLAQRIENDEAIVTAHLDRLDVLNDQHTDQCITGEEANLYAIIIFDDMRHASHRSASASYLRSIGRMVPE